MSLVEVKMPTEKCEAVVVRAKRWPVRALDYEQALLRSCPGQKQGRMGNRWT